MRFLFPRYDRKADLTFLLRDEFTTPDAAPITTPRTAEPGLGTWNANESSGSMSIASGKILFTGYSGSYDDPRLYTAATYARAAGVSFLAYVTCEGGDETGYFGFDNNAGGINAAEHTFGFAGNLLRDGVTTTAGYSASGSYTLAIVLRAAGAFYFAKRSTTWILTWVNSSKTTANLYVGAGVYKDNISFDYIRIAQLAAPFDTANGLATDTELGTPAVGKTFTHEADCLIEFVATTLPSAGTIILQFRIQDSNNLWQAQINSVGDLKLIEVVSGATTLRGNISTILSGGERIVIIAHDETITGYYDNTQAWSYTSAANFKTETDGKAFGFGTDGVVTDIITWPRTISGAALTELEKYTA